MPPKPEPVWTVYEDPDFGFKISYPENLAGTFNKDVANGVVQIMADSVPEKPNDYVKGWNDSFSNDENEKKIMGAVSINVQIISNQAGLGIVDLLSKLTNGEIGWDDPSINEMCLLGEVYNADWLAKNTFEFNGLTAVRRQMGVCPPGGGGSDIIFVATPDRVYKIRLNMTGVNSELDDGYWRDLFKRVFNTFELL